MALRFDPISSPGATRDLFVDLTGVLEEGEVISLATVVSGYPTALSVSNVATNENTLDFGEQEIAVGKGVHFTIETLQESQAIVPLSVSFEGDSGTVDRYEILQPLVSSLRE